MGFVSGLAMKDIIFVWKRSFGLIKFRSRDRKKADLVFSAPRAARAHVLSRVLSLSAKCSGISEASQAAVPRSVAVCAVVVSKVFIG